MNVLILQPPLVQFNTPYPSGAYLSAFFNQLKQGTLPRAPEDTDAAAAAAQTAKAIGTVTWKDTSCMLFHRLFCRAGVARLFAMTAEKAVRLAEAYQKAPETERAAEELFRYVSTQQLWIEWIDDIVGILETGNRERAHTFIRSPYAPRGSRMDTYLMSLEKEAPAVDDARILATLAIEDLADYITAVYDPCFSLVKYAESIAAGKQHFNEIESALTAPLLTDYYEPLLQEIWDNAGQDGEKLMLCITVPFPGCLAAGLSAAASAKRRFKENVTVVMGGGYVNTELRAVTAEALFTYVDYLSFDRGYGSLAAIAAAAASAQKPDAPLYNTIHKTGSGTIANGLRANAPDFSGWENAVTAALVPDFTAIDFSRYPRLADSTNPMHRIWSDGAWLKAYLAHGCYWHNCSFCDVQLDYICNYRPVNVTALYNGLLKQAEQTGIYGIHFVDEAAPPRALKEFALENIRRGCPLTFWGNIRFEKTFTRDLADLLARGGLIGVSGGIEIATEKGFKAVGKGIDLETLVCCCAAFKEAGVLIHSYLIYGYWNETAADISDSTETMRQLFAAGLIDSAFWHKFVLTRHSRVYREWTQGKHRDLEPIITTGDFAGNDCRFRGEEKSSRYTEPLDASLAAWMNGSGLDVPVTEWFPFKMPEPRIDRTLVDSYIAVYEEKTNRDRAQPYEPMASYLWTGGVPVQVSAVAPERYRFVHMGETVTVTLPEAAAGLLKDAAVIKNAAPLAACSKKTFRKLRCNGLVRI